MKLNNRVSGVEREIDLDRVVELQLEEEYRFLDKLDKLMNGTVHSDYSD